MLYLLFNESTHRLSSNAIHIWCARLDLKVFIDRTRNFHRLLSDDELSRANSIEPENSRNEFIISRGILRTISANYLGVKPKEVNFRYNRNQKPSLSRTASNPEDIQFNLTHSYGLAIYAFSPKYRIGSDVEWMNRPSIEDANGKYSIADRFFSHDERDYLSKLRGVSRRREAFLKLWTAKEALLKARGENLGALASRQGSTFNFSNVLNKRRGILRVSSKECPFSFWQLEPINHYIGTVVREGPSDAKLKIWKLITEKQAKTWVYENLNALCI